MERIHNNAWLLGGVVCMAMGGVAVVVWTGDGVFSSAQGIMVALVGAVMLTAAIALPFLTRQRS